MHQSIGQGHGRHRKPRGIGQVRAGFHHDHLAAGPGGIKAKLIVLHAEVAVAGLHLGQPGRGGQTGKGVAPAKSTRQIIDRREVMVKTMILESVWTDVVCVARERDAGQAETVSEPVVSDADDAVCNRHGSQVVVIKEDFIPWSVAVGPVMILVKVV